METKNHIIILVMSIHIVKCHNSYTIYDSLDNIVYLLPGKHILCDTKSNHCKV